MLKVSVWFFKHIKAHWILLLSIICVSLISILYQPIEGEDVGKDWRTITFRQDNAIHWKKNSYFVFMCLQANRGECQNAVCHECHEIHSKAQKRSQGVSSGKMNWSSLVTMSYAICRFVLTCGGVPGIIWEIHSGLIVWKVVPSVRGCLMWGISEWGCFVSRKFVVSCFRSPRWVDSAAEWAWFDNGSVAWPKGLPTGVLYCCLG